MRNANRRTRNRRFQEELAVTDTIYVVKDLDTGEVVSDVMTDEDTAVEVAQDIADEQGTEVILEAYVRAGKSRNRSLSEARGDYKVVPFSRASDDQAEDWLDCVRVTKVRDLCQAISGGAFDYKAWSVLTPVTGYGIDLSSPEFSNLTWEYRGVREKGTLVGDIGTVDYKGVTCFVSKWDVTDDSVLVMVPENARLRESRNRSLSCTATRRRFK